MNRTRTSAWLKARMFLQVLVPMIATCPIAWGGTPEYQYQLRSRDAARGDEFGYSIDLDDHLAIVGAPSKDIVGVKSGAAYLVDLQTGQELQRFVPLDGGPNQSFGYSVAIQDGLAIVGALGDNSAGDRAGAVYGFDVATGSQLWKLTSPQPRQGAEFGVSVELDAGVMAVGAHKDGTGTAFLFDASSRNLMHRLVSHDAAPDDLFGVAVALHSGRVLVGARYDDDQAIASGSAYLFDVATGKELQKVTPHDGDRGDRFGMYLDLTETRSIVASRYDDDVIKSSGSAYIYDNFNGLELHKIVAADATKQDEFGSAVAAYGNQVLIGAVDDDDRGTYAGSAYLFDVETGRQTQKILPPDATAFDRFGIAAAMNDQWMVIGASMINYNNAPNLQSGKIYVYQIPEPSTGVLSIVGTLALCVRQRRQPNRAQDV